MRLYKKEGVVAERPHLNLPKDTYEEEIGLDGFFGPVSHLYHYQPPTQWSDIHRNEFQWNPAKAVAQDFLKPLCFRKSESKRLGDFFSSSELQFWNEDAAVHVHRLTKDNLSYFRNADANELFFCHEGSVLLESPFGVLQVEKGDYISVPRGVTYRFRVSEPAYLLRIESFKEAFKKPETGILGQQALYHEEGIQSPLFSQDFAKEQQSKVVIQKDQTLTEVIHDYDIREISGWCGTLYPFVLAAHDIAPILSSVAHLPPSVNSTFVTSQFIVCTFLPRPLEEPEGALKVPFYHSNIDYDEVIFYHEGDFFSRDNMDAGYMTLHPRGINHGPHPKAMENQNKMKRTSEVAVMIDTIKPLQVSEEASSLEVRDYWKSWKKS